MQRLIVNADDLGLTRGVNRAVAELHEHGVLTSATLMAQAGATEEAIALALKTPTLDVGCHLVLVDGEPVLPHRMIPRLTDAKTRQFQPTLGRFLQCVIAESFRSTNVEGNLEGEIEVEAAAQIALLQGRGLRLTHIDTHKHTHMFPVVLRPVLRAARAAGISTVRNPFEPQWSRRATLAAPLLRRIEVGMLRRFEPAFLRIVAEEGFTTTDGALGVLATGTLNTATINSLLISIPPGTWELVTHPGYNDQDLAQVRTRLKASREMERTSLGEIQSFSNLDLISFADLPDHRKTVV